MQKARKGRPQKRSKEETRASRLEQFLFELPGPWHHPFAQCRARRLKNQKLLHQIPKTTIWLLPYLHLAFHMAFGNGTPREIIAWIRRGLVPLDSLPCIIIFGGKVKAQEAINIIGRRYSLPDSEIYEEAFAKEPLHYRQRWGSGVEIKIREKHIRFLQNQLPQGTKEAA